MVSIKFAIILIVLGAAAAYWFAMKVTRPARHAARKAAQEAAEKKAKEEALGRERNEREMLRRNVLGILNEAVGNPERLRGMRSYGEMPMDYDALRRFIQSHGEIRQAADRLVHYERAQASASQERRDIIATQKDIQKALGMGQPVQ